MSNFICEHCGKTIIDTENGHITSCKHYPVTIWQEENERRSSIIFGEPDSDKRFGIETPKLEEIKSNGDNFENKATS